MVTEWQLRARSFGAQAELYQRTRPSYPAALLDAILEPGWTTVADIGAGTGKLTALLRARNLQVTAVEPDAGMRSVLGVTAPDAAVVEGTGEAIPLADRTVDAVTFAQAWHWVDHDLGFAEAARVLKPGGALILIWNVQADESWIRDVDNLMQSGARSEDFDDLHLNPAFDAPRRVEIPWIESITRELLMERATTWSAVATLPEHERSVALEKLRRLLDTHPDLLGAAPLSMPHKTLAFVYPVR